LFFGSADGDELDFRPLFFRLRSNGKVCRSDDFRVGHFGGRIAADNRRP
jgi:hypothetical protein